uniref:Glycosyltransferase family 4 protein n=1 Tax=Prevotella sp. GTC17260 TaxID=3236796 RepID=A0AB33JI56_9BACT
MEYYYLTHYESDTYPFLIRYLNKEGLHTRYLHAPTSHGEYVNGLLAAWRAVAIAEHGTIITYLSSVGVLCWWVSLLRHKKVKIVATNLALKDDSSQRTRLMGFLYRHALRSKRFTLTVTSRKYGQAMQLRLHHSQPFHLLRDYNQYPGYVRAYSDNGKRIFCGGNTQRDWARCLRLAKLMPDWIFMLVGYESDSNTSVPKNVKIYRRLSFAYFIQASSQSTFVYLPTKWNCPAGLTVLMHATWNGRVVAVSANDVTEEYVTPDRGIISNDCEQVARQMRSLYANPDCCQSMVAAMQHFLTEECSAEAYCKSMESILT